MATITKVDDDILIKAEFHEVDRLKSIVKGMVWSPSQKAWTVPATISTFKNLKEYAPKMMEPTALSPIIREWYYELLERATRLDALQRGIGESPAFDQRFTFPAPPYKHQAECIAFALNLPKSAIWLQMGLGKTYVSITIARYRHEIFNQVNNVLVIAPLAVLRQWREQIEQYAKGCQVTLLDGTLKKKQKGLATNEHGALAFTLVTYESLTNLDFDDTSYDMFILDESTKIKNPKAQRTKATWEICASIPFGVQLTGAAYLNNPVDLYSQFKTLDPTVYGINEYSFSDHYINWVRRPFGRIPMGLKNADELKRRAYFIAFSRTKEECLDLPEKVYLQRVVPMYPEQYEWYSKVHEEVMGQIEVQGDTLNLNGVLAQMEKLQQITSGFITLEDGKTVWFDSPKYAEAIELIEESNNSFIVWLKHLKAFEYFTKMLDAKKIPYAELNRRISDIKRDDNIKAFKKGICKVLVCSIQSECRGLDLTSLKSVDSIYLENTYSWDERTQSESRQHRIGMSGSASYVDIMCEDTVDELVLDVLLQKKNISNYIMEMGRDIKLGKGGTIATRKTKTKRKLRGPDDIEPEEDLPKVRGL